MSAFLATGCVRWMQTVAMDALGHFLLGRKAAVDVQEQRHGHAKILAASNRRIVWLHT